jgi:uncharacterized protein
VREFIKARPLLTYFLLAFTVTWALFIPILLSPRAFNVIPLPDAVGLIFFILATILGPFLSSVIVTWITEGKKSVKTFLARILQWKVGWRWYLVILIGYPLVLILGQFLFYGANIVQILSAKWPLLFSVYLAAIPVNMLLPGIGEETGWRGFALPRLQKMHGPLTGTLILGSIHAFWHLPAYFVPGAITDHFSMSVFGINSLAIIIMSFLWTWVFNNAKQSILIAILLHASSNAISALAPQLYNINDPWEIVKIFGLTMLIVIAVTKGKLGYSSKQ